MKKSILALGILLAGAAFVPATSSAAQSGLSWGGDLRVRLVNWDEIPIARGNSDLNQWQYHRTRTRVWGQYNFSPNLAVKGRLVNEFWDHSSDKPTGQPAESKEFPSEVVVDNLYIDVKNLLGGKLSLRLGRQDMIYGTGKMILDGTPEDGSRTIYFNAVKAQYKAGNKLSIDLIGAMNKNEDEFAINSQSRNLSPNDIDESLAGIYIKKGHANYPFEAYYLYKGEDDVSTANNDIDLHTFGVRLMPKISKSLSANLEVAYQSGEMDNDVITDIGGVMVDAKLAYKLPVAPAIKPVVDVSYYYLSGDDSDTTTENEAFWQVFGRWSQFKELAVYSMVASNNVNGTNQLRTGPAWWSNISVPSVGLKMAVTDKGNLDLRAHWMMADEDDGNGTGTNRGLYLTSKLKYNFTKAISSHLVYEFLNPGDYYADGTINSHFIRTELMYKF
ncbi:MAG: alginate export family protein [Magnetococcales bacterium]|nr:alginate export family protein [Magnetococcales bacterium]